LPTCATKYSLILCIKTYSEACLAAIRLARWKEGTRPECKADRSSSFTAEVKNTGAIAPVPHTT